MKKVSEMRNNGGDGANGLHASRKVGARSDDLFHFVQGSEYERVSYRSLTPALRQLSPPRQVGSAVFFFVFLVMCIVHP